MEFFSLIKERYSVRQFSDKKISDTDVDTILQAGRIAPTAKNMQPVKVIVLQSDEGINIANECSPCIYGAKTVFVICGDRNISFKHPDGRDFMEMDASIVTTHMMLAAHDLGLGACWVGMFETEAVKKMLNLPENIIPVAFLPVGYIDAPASERHEIRKPMEEFADRR